jgi:hypothetical protein
MFHWSDGVSSRIRTRRHTTDRINWENLIVDPRNPRVFYPSFYDGRHQLVCLQLDNQVKEKTLDLDKPVKSICMIDQDNAAAVSGNGLWIWNPDAAWHERAARRSNSDGTTLP